MHECGCGWLVLVMTQCGSIAITTVVITTTITICVVIKDMWRRR